MNAKISAHYLLTGFDADPAEITASLGIAPTKTWRAGDPFDSRSGLRRRRNGWVLGSDLEDSRDLEEHVQSVLRKFQATWPEAVRLSEQYDAEIQCVIYCYGREVPSIHFDKETVVRVAELGAGIDVDLYALVESS